MDQGSQDMSFGSPGSTTSPVGPGYLPAYLLGSSAQTNSPLPGSWHRLSSSGGFRGSPSHSATHGNPRLSGYDFSSPQKQQYRNDKALSVDKNTPRSIPGMSHTPTDKIGAPPVEDLYGHKMASPPPRPLQHASMYSSQCIEEPGFLSPRTLHRSPGPTTPGSSVESKIFSPRHRVSPPSPAQIDPFYTQGEEILSDDVLDECWVTVFGFPPAATSFILQQFSQYGNIVKHVVASNGNWVHLQYQSKLQAKKALSKNGKIYGSGIMVGVRPCIDKSVMERTGKENIPATPIRDNMPHPSTPSKMPIRPLTAAYQAVSSTHQVVPEDGRTPQKNTNILSKTMEYVFGW